MPFIGNQPSNNFVSLKRQDITGDGTASYTLDYKVASVNDILVYVNHVKQDPSSMTVSGTSLTMGGNVASTDDFYVIFLGQGLQTVTPADNTITNSMLSSGSFSNITGVGTLSGGLTLSDNILFDTASKGIYLGVTSATASNLLDDYEEGTWTPTIHAVSGFTNTGVTNNYSTYTKIGNLVNIKTYLQFPNSSGNVSSGDVVQVRGLPFSPSTQDNTMFCSFRYNNGNNATGWVSTATATNEFRWVCAHVNGSPTRSGGAVSINFFYSTS